MSPSGWATRPPTGRSCGGESLDNIEETAELISQADVFVVVGTSLVVYPAAIQNRYFKGK